MSETRTIPARDDPAEATRDAAVAPALLAWYDRHRRDLPWRSPPGVASDPYAVWLSEIMLQQTTVAAVKPYFTAFLAAWPTVGALANAPLDDVLKAWAGLGYYSRARNLHACATQVRDRHGSRFPPDEAILRTLPGVGRYTAAAIASIAFGRRAVVVDGNVERVMARLFGVETPLPEAKPRLYALMDRVTPTTRVGDFAQATMDLGATICTPRKPLCGLCPLRDPCAAARDGLQASLPRKAAKKPVPLRVGDVFVIRRPDGAILVRQRPANGLFGGMMEFPSTDWIAAENEDVAGTSLRSFNKLEAKGIGTVNHGLTHFSLELRVHAALWDSSEMPVIGGRWVAEHLVASEALPTLMRKVLTLANQAHQRRPADLCKTPTKTVEAQAGLFALEPVSPRRRRAPGPDAFRTRRRPRQGTRPGSP